MYKTFHIKHILNCIYGKYIYILFNTIVYVVICIIPEVFCYRNWERLKCNGVLIISKA